MTENKRFEWDNVNIAIKDNVTKKKYWIDVTCIDDIVDLMNKTWEQTQRFEKYNQRLTQENIKYEDRIAELKNENEQLKHQIKDMQIRFKRKYDYEFDEIVDELDNGLEI